MKSKKVSWKIEKIAKMEKTKKINFDLVIQRKRDIWDVKRQSILIHSILSGYPISTLFATKEENVYNFLDGKQRLGSTLNFIRDNFKLHPQTPPIGEIQIAGLKFSELPEELQNKIKQYEIDVVCIEEITQEEMEELFYRLNNGVPLRQIETTRALLGAKVLRFVEAIAEMDFFARKVNLSASARRRYVDQELILQILALIYNSDTGFSSKEIQNFVKTLRNTEIQDTLRAKIQNACYYLNEAFPKKEKFLKKIHVPMLFYIVLELIEKGELSRISAVEFGQWAKIFFDNPPTEYVEACRSSSARKDNVQKRLSTMKKEFYEYLNEKEARESLNRLKQQIEEESAQNGTVQAEATNNVVNHNETSEIQPVNPTKEQSKIG